MSSTKPLFDPAEIAKNVATNVAKSEAIIEKFLLKFNTNSEQNSYQHDMAIVRDFLNNLLHTVGIQGHIYARVKDGVSLEAKLKSRNLAGASRELIPDRGVKLALEESTKNKSVNERLNITGEGYQKLGYESVEHIHADLKDTIGLRVCLSYNSDLDAVNRLIHYYFDMADEQKDININGYGATHYRVFWKKEAMPKLNNPNVVMEIQVMTILMNAYQECQHDVIYKPHGGAPSNDEKEYLGQMSGLVRDAEEKVRLMGEKLKERIRKSGQGAIIKDTEHGLGLLLNAYAPAPADKTAHFHGKGNLTFALLVLRRLKYLQEIMYPTETERKPGQECFPGDQVSDEMQKQLVAWSKSTVEENPTMADSFLGFVFSSLHAPAQDGVEAPFIPFLIPVPAGVTGSLQPADYAKIAEYKCAIINQALDALSLYPSHQQTKLLNLETVQKSCWITAGGPATSVPDLSKVKQDSTNLIALNELWKEISTHKNATIRACLGAARLSPFPLPKANEARNTFYVQVVRKAHPIVMDVVVNLDTQNNVVKK